MAKLKVIFTIVTLLGITGMTVTGATAADIGVYIPIGVGVGTAVSAIIAVFSKKEK